MGQYWLLSSHFPFLVPVINKCIIIIIIIIIINTIINSE